MNDFLTKGTLSVQRRRLLETMQRLNFGRIEGLEVRRGEPVFSPPPRLTEEIRLGSGGGPRPELERDDFLLRAPVIELFEHLCSLGEGSVAAIEIRHGLPVKLSLERPASR